MSLPALDDIVTHTGTTEPIDGVVRIETTPLEETAGTFFSQLRSALPSWDALRSSRATRASFCCCCTFSHPGPRLIWWTTT